MIDKDKVIKGLEEHKNRRRYSCDNCPYVNDPRCVFNLYSDALALLKRQPRCENYQRDDNVYVAVYERKINRCACGHEVNRYWHPEYCGFCGKKLEWY